MGRDGDLRAVMHSIVPVYRKQVIDLADEYLLKLCMQMRLRFFNENEMQQWTIFFNIHPLRVQTQQLNDHIDQIPEPKTVIVVRQCRRFIGAADISKRIMDASTIMAAHDGRWIESRF